MVKEENMHAMEAQIWANPAFQQLVKRRNRLMWILFALTLIIFFAFAISATFAPELFGISLWNGASTTFGVLIGIAVMVLPCFLTGIYVYRANREFDISTIEILQQAEKAQDK